MKKRLAALLLGICSLAAIGVYANNETPATPSDPAVPCAPVPCYPAPCDTVPCVPCDTVCAPVPCTTPAPAPATTPVPCYPMGC